MPQRYTKTCSRIDCVGWWINSCYLLTCLSMSPSPTVTKERFGNLCQDWVRSDECSSASKIHLLGKFQNILKWQQCTSVYSHTQGGVKTLTSWPAGWLWSSVSDCALLCSSQSVVDEWWRAHGYKAGTVTEVTWLSEEKAAWPVGLTAMGLFACICTTLTDWGLRRKSTQSKDACKEVLCWQKKTRIWVFSHSGSSVRL